MNVNSNCLITTRKGKKFFLKCNSRYIVLSLSLNYLMILPMINLAIFSSGNGTNAENIINYFNKRGGKSGINVKVLFCNNPQAGVIARARKLGVPVVVLSNEDMTISHKDNTTLTDLLNFFKVNAVILAGYLLKVPSLLIHIFPEKIINIHPALLPKYGGKGMYGHHVHEAVIAAGERESGITIHLADEVYDNGRIIFQAKCSIAPDDTPDTLAAKIHELEQANFPEEIERYLKKDVKKG